MIRSQFEEGRFWLEQAVACDEGLPPIVRARVRGDAGFLRAYFGAFAAAAPLIDDALALARACDDPCLLADTLLGAGYLAERQEHLARAKALSEESVRVARAIDPGLPYAGRLVGMALYTLGSVADRSGDRALAIARHEEAIRSQRAAGGSWFLSLTLTELGVMHVCAGNVSEATAYLVEAMALTWRLREDAIITRERGKDLFFPSQLRGLAAAAAVTGQPEAAARLLGAADVIDPHTHLRVCRVARPRAHRLVSRSSRGSPRSDRAGGSAPDGNDLDHWRGGRPGA